MKNFLLNMSSLLIIFSSFSCKKSISNDTEVIPHVVITNLSDTIKTSIGGIVVDENNLAKAGVLIRAGGLSATTDSRGSFNINGTLLNKNASLITAELSGYFKSYRTTTTSDSTIKFIKIKLLPKTLAGTVDATIGGSVTLSDNTIITLPASGVVNKISGSPYIGAIKVFARPIDPTSTTISQTVPGSFMGIDSTKDHVLLKSYGMLVAELEGSNGEQLQIASSKKAKIRQPINAALLSTANVKIPMWYLDESDGLWKQEGEGIKIGSNYEGEVSHFSYWNYDYDIKGVFLEMTIFDNIGNPLPNTLIKISNATGPFDYGYTDSKGYVRLLFGQNLNATLEVIGENCNTVFFTTSLGAFAQNTNIGNVIVNLANNNLRIGGVVNDCNGNPVTSGNVLFFFDGKYYNVWVATNGSFKATIPNCNTSTSLEIYAKDFLSNIQGNPSTYNIITGNVLNLNLVACGQSSSATGTLFVAAANFGTITTYEMFAIKPNTGEVIWKKNVYPTGLGILDASATFANGKLFYTDSHGLYSLDTSSKLLTLVSPIPYSTFYSNHTFYNTPLYANNSIYFNSGPVPNTGYLRTYRYNLNSNSSIFVNIGQEGLIENGLTASNGVVYGSRVALNENDLSVNWQNEPSTGLVARAGPSSPAISNGAIFFGYANKFYASNAVTGAIKWSYTLDSILNTTTVVYSSPTIYNGKVYFGATDSTFYALNEITGLLEWKKKVGGKIYASPIISNNKVFFNSEDKNLYALNPANGNLIWKQSLPSASSLYSSPLIADGSVYLACGDSKLYSIDANTGFINWSVLLGYFGSNSPILVNGSGVVFHPGTSGEQN